MINYEDKNIIPIIKTIIEGIQDKNAGEIKQAIEKWFTTNNEKPGVNEEDIKRALRHVYTFNVSAQGVRIDTATGANLYISPPPPIRRLNGYEAFFKITQYNENNPLDEIDAPWIAVPKREIINKPQGTQAVRRIQRGINYAVNRLLGPTFYHNIPNPKQLQIHDGIYQIQTTSPRNRPGTLFQPLMRLVDPVIKEAYNAHQIISDYITTIRGPICYDTEQKPREDAKEQNRNPKADNNQGTYIRVVIRLLREPILELDHKTNKLIQIIPEQQDAYRIGEWHERMLNQDQRRMINNHFSIQRIPSEQDMDDVFAKLGLIQPGLLATKTWGYFDNPHHYTGGLVIMAPPNT